MKVSYFLIFFIGYNENGTVYGNIALSYSSKFINRNETIAYINETQKVKESVITSLIRLSKNEYDEWLRS